MTSDYELAKMLFPKPRDIVREATAGTPKTSQVRGVATSDSADGSVSVILDTVAGGENAEMTIPTAGGIVEGAEVIVTLLDGTPIDVLQSGNVDTAQATANAATNQVDNLRVYTDTRIDKTASDITAVITETTETMNADMNAAVERISVIEKSVQISSDGVTIAASDSPITANLDNDGLTFKAGDEAVLTLNAQTSTAEADRVSIGHYQWREMGDNAIALVWIGA